MPASSRSRREPSDGAVYKPTPSAPKQQHFPSRRRAVKTYGSSKSTRTSRQGTLTQMDFISPSPADVINVESEGEMEENSQEAPEDKVASRGRSTRRRKSHERNDRRRTLGDKLELQDKPRDSKRRKTMGDSPSPSASSSFHTQTLTQFMSNSFKSENEQDFQIKDSDDDDTDGGLILETPTKPQKQLSVDELASAHSTGSSFVRSGEKPTTPSNRRLRTEIPSSQSPLTPMLARYSPLGPRVSPLKGKTVRTPMPPSALKRMSAQKTPRDAVIQDSYSTMASSPTTPTAGTADKNRTPKKARFDIPEDKENITPGRTKPKSPREKRKPSNRPPLQDALREVPDSDAELDDDDETEGETEDEEIVNAKSQVMQSNDPEQVDRLDFHEASADDSTVQQVSADDAEPETCYGLIGEETQAELASIELQDLADENNGGTHDALSSSAIHQTTPTATIGSKRHVTPVEDDSSVPSTPSDLNSPSKPPRKRSPKIQPSTQFLPFTQGFESQRLTLETIRDLGPQTVHSDIVVTLHPSHVEKIVNRTKNHEFRVWEMPPQVSRVWIYSTRPESTLRYMCVFGPAKAPGEVKDKNGLGNDTFNSGKTANKWAYEILQVYELNNPVPLDRMIEKGWLKKPPPKYSFIPPAVVGELTSNLRCALFEDSQVGGSVIMESSPNFTESQELQRQIQRDVEYSTQHLSSDNLMEGAEETIESSQSPPTKRSRNGEINETFARPALPESAIHRRSSQSLQQPSLVRPSQATTVSQMSSSSPNISPAKSLSRPQPVPLSSQPFVIEEAGESYSSPATHNSGQNPSLRSSQFPTKSQMLPDSLVNDVLQEPPPIIWDSADEQSD